TPMPPFSFSKLTHWSRSVWRNSVLAALAIGGCAIHPPPETHVDLTYAFNEQTVYWPLNKSFLWEKTKWGLNKEGKWYASATFAASEHGGTHIDAPIHFAESGWSVDEIPVSQLTGEAIVLDIRSQADSNPDYTLQVEDIIQWESVHGRIPAQSLVLLFTGYGQYWPEKSRYLGSPTPEDP